MVRGRRRVVQLGMLPSAPVVRPAAPARLFRAIGARSALAAIVAVALCAAAPGAAQAAEYHYVDWLTADVAQGTASGTITLPDGSTVQVGFAAINPDGSHGNLYGAQVNGGTNYWNPATPYVSAEVANAPPSTDLLQLSGGEKQIYRVTLSEPIKDPVMAIVSLGQPSLRTTYDFDAPFTIVSQGSGYWGGGATALVQLPNDVLEGSEGHGTIRFIGTFATFSWTVPTPESWHGFTFAIRTTEKIEPTPDAGAPDAGAPDAGVAADAGAQDADTGFPEDGAEDAGDAGLAMDTGAAFDAGDAGSDAGDGGDAALEPLADARAAEDAADVTDDVGDGGDDEEDDPADDDVDGGLTGIRNPAHTIEANPNGGCGCAAAGGWPDPGATLPGLLLLAAWIRRRRRSGAQPSQRNL